MNEWNGIPSHLCSNRHISRQKVHSWLYREALVPLVTPTCPPPPPPPQHPQHLTKTPGKSHPYLELATSAPRPALRSPGTLMPVALERRPSAWNTPHCLSHQEICLLLLTPCNDSTFAVTELGWRSCHFPQDDAIKKQGAPEVLGAPFP